MLVEAQADQKYAYYLSMEFLQGRALLNAVENLEMADEVRAALAKVRPIHSPGRQPPPHADCIATPPLLPPNALPVLPQRHTQCMEEGSEVVVKGAGDAETLSAE
jgi:hypothetical protein